MILGGVLILTELHFLVENGFIDVCSASSIPLMLLPSRLTPLIWIFDLIKP